MMREYSIEELFIEALGHRLINIFPKRFSIREYLQNLIDIMLNKENKSRVQQKLNNMSDEELKKLEK